MSRWTRASWTAVALTSLSATATAVESERGAEAPPQQPPANTQPAPPPNPYSPPPAAYPSGQPPAAAATPPASDPQRQPGAPPGAAPPQPGWQLTPPFGAVAPGADPGATDDDDGPQGLRLAASTESAFGLTSEFFYNHLAGGRLDYRFSRHVALGGYLGYANLRGKSGRAHNVLSYAQLEYRALPWDSVGIPVRFAAGYLPNNGPWLRTSLGVSFELTDTTELVFDLLAPTFWYTDDLLVVSLNLGAELAFAL